MIAIELVKEGNANQPDPELTKALLNECYESGLVVLTCGMYGNVFRFLPALTICDEVLREGLSIFTEAFKELN